MGEEKLVSVQVVYRHGDRTPLETYPNDPHKNYILNEAKPGHLTNRGKQRQYELGKWLRNRYENFLPAEYSPDDITVISNDMDRCLMSAASCLCGLYPPVKKDVWNEDIKWQPIPIHTNAALLDPLLRKLIRLLITTDAKDAIRELTEEYKGLKEYVQEHSGRTIKNFYDLFLFRDALYIESLENLTLPDWTKQVYPEPLNTFSSRIFGFLTYDNFVSKITIGSLLREIANNFEAPPNKLTMYSAHDYTVACIISILAPGYHKFTPEFSTIVIFELWEKNGERFIKMVMKRDDNVETISISDGGEVCGIENFKKAVEPISIPVEDRERLLDEKLAGKLRKFETSV